MRTSKPPFKISFYLDQRFARYGQKRIGQSRTKRIQGIKPVGKKNSFTLVVRVYSRFEKKVQFFNTGRHYTVEQWNSIENANTLKEKDPWIKQTRAEVDAILSRFELYNDPKYKTLQQFESALEQNVEAITPEKSYLIVIWEKYLTNFAAFTSDSNKQHHMAAIKSFVEFLNITGKDPKTFLVQNVNKSFLESYLKYKQDEGKIKTSSIASYLDDLKTAIMYAQDELKLISEQDNPFVGKKGFKIPKKRRRADDYTLDVPQLKSFLEAPILNQEEQKARDIFAMLFLMGGHRINDLLLLRKDSIKESRGDKYFEMTPNKTARSSGKVAKILITDQIKNLIDKYPGQGKYVLDVIPEDTPTREEKRIGKNKYRKLVDRVKDISKRIEGLPNISWSFSRYSVNHYLTVNDYATRSQIAELQVNSTEVNKGYFSDVGNKKFEIQEKLSGVIDTKEKKKSLGKKANK